MTALLRAGRGGTVLAVKVRPKASWAWVGPAVDGRLTVTVTEPPEGGKANRAVIKTLAKKLGIAQSRLGLISGETSRIKTILIQGLSVDKVRQRLNLGEG